MRFTSTVVLCSTLALWFHFGGIANPAHAAEDKARPDFERDVLPLFKEHCYQCHDARKQKAGLRLDVRSNVLSGGESGKPGIIPGNSKKSEIIRRVTSAEENEVMPPKGGPLSAGQVKLLSAWID